MPPIFPGIVLGVAMMQIFLAAPISIYGAVAALRRLSKPEGAKERAHLQ